MTDSITLAKLAGATLKRLEQVKHNTVSGDDSTTDQIVILLEAFAVVGVMVEERIADELKKARGPG